MTRALHAGATDLWSRCCFSGIVLVNKPSKVFLLPKVKLCLRCNL
jgi:hypothetical protein